MTVRMRAGVLAGWIAFPLIFLVLPAHGEEYPHQRQMIEILFRSYEQGEMAAIRVHLLPEVPDAEVINFHATLENLASPDKVLSHSFRILPSLKIYRDKKVHDFGGIMADVEVCDMVTFERAGSSARHQKGIYLYYHFHFNEGTKDRKDGTYFLYFGNPDPKIDHPSCAP